MGCVKCCIWSVFLVGIEEGGVRFGCGRYVVLCELCLCVFDCVFVFKSCFPNLKLVGIPFSNVF